METKNEGASPGQEQAPQNNSNDNGKDTKKDSASTPKTPINKIVWTADEIAKLSASKPKYLLDNLLPDTGLAALVGKPDTGKSQFVRQLSIAIASGANEFIGLRLNPIHKRVIYVLGEDYPDAISFPFNAQLKALGHVPTKSISFISAGALRTQDIMMHIRAELRRAAADLIVIDTFGHIFTGSDLNNNASMRYALKPFNEIASEFNCLTLFLHHVTKSSSDKPPSIDHVLGGGGFGQVMRSVLYLKDGKENKRTLTLVKGNYSPKRLKENSFILEFSEETFLFTNTTETVATYTLGVKPAGFGIKPNEAEDESPAKLEQLAVKIFAQGALRHGEYLKRHSEVTSQSVSTANRRLNDLQALGLITQTDQGYCLATASASSSSNAPDAAAA